MSIASNIDLPIFNVNRENYPFLYENYGMSIGQRIREARKAAKLTQEYVAKKSGIKQPTLSDLERGESASSSELVAIAIALNVNPSWLQYGRGEMKPLPGESEAGDLDAAMDLLALFSRLSPERRADLIRFARTLVGRIE